MCVAAAVALAASVGAAEEKDKAAAKPSITCEKIVETYKRSKSVDETAGALFVDQKRVAECLKAAGISAPLEDNR
jgi:hypothetical protein